MLVTGPVVFLVPSTRVKHERTLATTNFTPLPAVNSLDAVGTGLLTTSLHVVASRFCRGEHLNRTAIRAPTLNAHFPLKQYKHDLSTTAHPRIVTPYHEALPS